jgi:hypothetical protein
VVSRRFSSPLIELGVPISGIRLGEHVYECGFSALKTNFFFHNESLELYMPGSGYRPWRELQDTTGRRPSAMRGV